MSGTTFRQGSHSAQTDSRRAAIATELEATRASFHDLLAAVSNTEWNHKSPSSEWTVKEVFAHLTWALEYLPEEVNRARRSQGMFNLPKRVSDTLSFWYMRWLARTATPASIARRYDTAMDASIALLETIPDEDWERGADFYGEGFHSVQDLFHIPAHHLNEHTFEMRARQPDKATLTAVSNKRLKSEVHS